MSNELMIKASHIVEVCEDYLQEQIDEKGLQAVKPANLELIANIMNLIEDSVEEYNPLKSNFKKPTDFN